MKENPTVRSIRKLGFQWQTSDPFLFCVHHEDFYPAGEATMGPDRGLLQGRQIGSDFEMKDGFRMYHGDTVPGFPGHPHRGFETITVVTDGFVDHSDSQGGAGRYGEGDVQWMTAGKGLQHSEMFPLLNQEGPNRLELFQIWLNLPAKSKMVDPDYKMLWRESIPTIERKDEQGKTSKVTVIAGEFDSQKPPAPPSASWAADAENHVSVLLVAMEPDAQLEIPATETGINRTIYVFRGNGLTIANQNVPDYHAAEVDPEQNLQITAGTESTRFLMLQGRPINEPVVQHGPFVMNSRQEIQQAFQEYQETRFGGWPWPTYENVFPREKGRFARYADGSEETP